MKIPVVNYFVSIFMLCSPLTAIPAFLNLTHGKHREERTRIASWLGVSVAAILVITTWIGGPLLSFLVSTLPPLFNKKGWTRLDQVGP